MSLEFDESLLTAYALGELDAPIRARVAAYVEAEPEAARFVEQVLETAGVVTDGLRSETVDGLTQLHRDFIEHRLQTLEHAARASSPAPATPRFPRWIPFAASIAASVAVVGGTVAYLAMQLPPHPALTASGDGTPNAGTPNVTESSDNGPGAEVLTTPTDDYATNTFPGFAAPDGADEANDEEWEPFEGMVDPREFREGLASQAPAREQPALSTPAPAPAVPAPDPAPAVAQGPAHSPEAEDVRSAKKSAVPKNGDRTHARKGVYVSPPRDPSAFREIAKSAKKDSAPKLYENPFRTTSERPRSSFPLRVETGSYKAIRESLSNNQLPPFNAVRIEELVNRFGYGYPVPTDDRAPLAATVEIATCPWNVDHRLARVTIRARDGGATVVARGVEVDVKFNADATTAWRLIGYENAPVAPGQSAGFPTDLAAGGAATAFYEIVPADARAAASVERFKLTVRYADAQDPARKAIEIPGTDTGLGFDKAKYDFRFASAVAGFGLLLRDSQFKGSITFPDVIRWAAPRPGDVETPERASFIEVAKNARDLSR